MPEMEPQFEIELIDVDPMKQIYAIKAIRGLTGLGLKAAKAMSELKGDLYLGKYSREEAEAIRSKFAEAGALVLVNDCNTLLAVPKPGPVSTPIASAEMWKQDGKVTAIFPSAPVSVPTRATIAMKREEMADRVIANFGLGVAKLITCKPDIALLRDAFKELRGEETIKGVTSFDAFCPKYLGRTSRAVRLMLAGGSRKSTLSRERQIQMVTARLVKLVTGDPAAVRVIVQRFTELLAEGKPEWPTSRGSIVGRALALLVTLPTGQRGIIGRVAGRVLDFVSGERSA